MRRLLVIPILAILIAAMLAPIYSSPAESYSLTVYRRAFVNEWGVVAINDTVTVKNIGTESVAQVLMGLPREYGGDLKYVSSHDQYGNGVAVEKDASPSSSIYWLKFSFPNPVQPATSYNFTSVMVVDNIIENVQGTYIYKFADAPSLPIEAEMCDVAILLPTGSAITTSPNYTFTQEEIGGMPSLVHKFEPLEPNRVALMSFNFTSVSVQFIKVRSVEREISFNADGSVHVSDTYDLRNLAASITSLTIQLPKDAYEVMAYDPLGTLWDDYQKGSEEATSSTFGVEVSPRIGTIRVDENFVFTLKYRLSSREHVKQLAWWGLYDLAFDLFTIQPWTVQKLTVRVIMDEGMNVENSSQQPNSTYVENGKNILLYEIDGVTPLHNLTFNVKYKYLSFWAAFRPITWLAVVEAIVAVFLVASRGKKAVPVSIAPVETIRRFIGLYDERMNLRLETEKIEEDMTRGGVSKHDYRHRKKAIDARLEEINRSLTSVKNDLRASAGRYGESIGKLDKAEAEIDAARASESQVKTQYRSGKINKDVYETVAADSKKRIGRARETIESITISLREEAR